MRCFPPFSFDLLPFIGAALVLFVYNLSTAGAVDTLSRGRRLGVFLLIDTVCCGDRGGCEEDVFL